MLNVFKWGGALLAIPHVLLFVFSKKRSVIQADLNRWCNSDQASIIDLALLLMEKKEFRNLFYHRLGKVSFFLRYLPPMSTLYICTDKIGEGLFIQHGFATVITAESIGKNCWINQQVTIGYNNSHTRGFGRPTIGDNVRISAGAKVVGPITIGDNSIIGVNAVVTKDVPPNSIIVPAKMRYILRNGERVDEVF